MFVVPETLTIDRGEAEHVYFFKNKLRKYIIIRLHNLKLDTDIVHI